MKAFVYLIRLDGFLGSPETHIARYYLGSCTDLKRRTAQHQAGQGAALLRACKDKGITWKIVKIQVCPSEKVARQLEQKLKAYKNHAQIRDRNWSEMIDKPTVQTLRKQIQSIGTLEFLSKVRKAIQESDPAIASELDELILSQKVLK
ncbi:GIY-YIG nuclease family protein [Myxacorys almedinensis]|uniref:GIY-YIG nuclease family protein n=1 Tax=Myxacorys almedinensis A TaxID=2690445 RepID=A0A8J7Z7D3_9CYAN|nr:GIY-YIG nuclease family protein [Myxacorys almedinensis]NDJ19471.1 GIY-YIG nuclease family protein [Myxacorys almedinensis A]